MLLNRSTLEKYRPEIAELYQQELGEELLPALVFFAIFAGEELQAVASIKNYMGTWYLRGCVVKKEYRGNGFGRQLMAESLDYLATRTEEARVSVFPGNIYSIRIIEAAGFEFERKKKLPDGQVVLVYKKKIR